MAIATIIWVLDEENSITVASMKIRDLFLFLVLIYKIYLQYGRYDDRK